MWTLPYFSRSCLHRSETNYMNFHGRSEAIETSRLGGAPRSSCASQQLPEEDNYHLCRGLLLKHLRLRQRQHADPHLGKLWLAKISVDSLQFRRQCDLAAQCLTHS